MEDIKHAVIDLGDDPRFAPDQPYMSGVDETTGHVVLTVVQLSDALADEIVRVYGTDAVEVSIDPDRPDLTLD